MDEDDSKMIYSRNQKPASRRKTLSARIRSTLLNKSLVEKVEKYEYYQTEIAKSEFQLLRLNQVWRTAIRTVEYYQDLKKKYSLPNEFQSLSDFVKKVPPLTRTLIQKSNKSLNDRSKKADKILSTGGSTGEPVQIGMWNREIRSLYFNKILGRTWYGIDPDDPLFLFWGHSHLLGTGLKGQLNAYKRQALDLLLGYCRANAYRLDGLNLELTYEKLRKFRPAYIIGYSVALDLLARTHLKKGESNFPNLNLKAVIGAAEAFPFPDSQEIITKVFRAPVGMEYGSVETLLMAHTHPSGQFKVFWDTYFMEAVPSGRLGIFSVFVTKLIPAKIPLIRYQLDDEILLRNGPTHAIFPLMEFDSVVGRCNEYVETSDGSRLHSEAFTHAVKDEEDVLSYQLLVDEKNLTLFLLVNGPLRLGLEKRIRKRLISIHPELAKVTIAKSSQLKQSIAGKISWIIRA